MITLLTICAGVIFYSMIVLLFGRKMEERDHVRDRVDLLEKESKKEYLLADENMDKSFYERLLKPTLSEITKIFARLLPGAGKAKSGNKTESYNKQKRFLEQAGLAVSVEDYTVIQICAVIGGGILCAILGVILQVGGDMIFLYSLGGAFGGFAILRYVVAGRVTSRKRQMEKQLPDMLDLLSVSVEAGLGFERALLHITESMEGPLIDEMSVTYREMSLGRNRREAFTLLSERCGIDEVQSFSSAIIQAGQLGIPIRNVLKSQSEAIRHSRSSKVKEKAAKVSTKILIPMLLFIFPVLFIVLLGPSVISIMETF